MATPLFYHDADAAEERIAPHGCREAPRGLMEINVRAVDRPYGRLASRFPGGTEIMDPVDLEYYVARIAAEENAAKRATHPSAAATHRRLAEAYASLVMANQDGSTPRNC